MQTSFDETRDAQAEEEPRGSDICPECGSGHTTMHATTMLMELCFHCNECGSFWHHAGGRGFTR